MGEIGSKAVIIGVSLFITMIIVTMIIFEISQVNDIYENVGETNISFEKRLDELAKYKDTNKIFTGLEVRNTIIKYEEYSSALDKVNPKDVIYKDGYTIDVCIKRSSTSTVCNDMLKPAYKNLIPTSDQYSDSYRSIFENTTSGYKIIFYGI